MDWTDKGSLHHEFSQCSAHFLGEGSLSCLLSDEGLGGVSCERSPHRVVAPRQPMVLVQLKRLAPKAGRLTTDCSHRVPRAERHYDLLVEPGEMAESKESERPATGDFDEGETWQSSLRRRKKQVTDQEDVDTSSELGLPATLHEEQPISGGLLRAETSSAPPRSKELQSSATWPLVGPGEMSATLSLSSSGNRSVQLEHGRQSLLAVPFAHRYAGRRLSDRRRSWLKANEANTGRGPGFSQRNQVREMVSIMMKTMTQTFDRSVWDACDVLHPHEELERATARQKKVLEDQIDQFKGLKPAIKGRRRSQRRESTRRSFGITAGITAVTPPILDEKPDERVLAHLAKQTGWSVLDVEEVWEIFSPRAPSGRISVQSQDFVLLVQDIYHGVTDEEIMLLQQHMKAVRTRNKARTRYMRRALTGGLDTATQERSHVRFSEFYVALVKWLELQEAREEASFMFRQEPSRRCALKRFAYQEAYENVVPSSSSDLFRGTLEVAHSFDTVQGARAALQKKSHMAGLEEDSNSKDGTNSDGGGDDDEDPFILVVQHHNFHVSSARSSASSGGDSG